MTGPSRQRVSRSLSQTRDTRRDTVRSQTSGGRVTDARARPAVTKVSAVSAYVYLLSNRRARLKHTLNTRRLRFVFRPRSRRPERSADSLTAPHAAPVTGHDTTGPARTVDTPRTSLSCNAPHISYKSPCKSRKLAVERISIESLGILAPARRAVCVRVGTRRHGERAASRRVCGCGTRPRDGDGRARGRILPQRDKLEVEI